MNPDPLEVWNEACQRSQDAWYEIGEQPNDPEGDAQQRLTNQAAAAVIAQHYAPMLAEVERGYEYWKSQWNDKMSSREIESLATQMCSDPSLRAPVQRYPGGIPWAMHMEAYAAYAKRWSPQVALIDLFGRGCRGGFGLREMDEFVPGWRDQLSERAKLLTAITDLEALVGELGDALVTFTRCAYPVSTELQARGHDWMPEKNLDYALVIARTTLAKLEKARG